jgi:hypothetical protein
MAILELLGSEYKPAKKGEKTAEKDTRKGAAKAAPAAKGAKGAKGKKAKTEEAEAE